MQNEIKIRHNKRIVMMGCWPGTADMSVPQGRCGNVSASRIFGKESSEDKTGKSKVIVFPVFGLLFFQKEQVFYCAIKGKCRNSVWW